MLWHKHLGHIAKQMLEKFIRDDVLPNFDISKVEICVDCIKWEMIAKPIKEKINRCESTLDLI